MDLVNFIRIFQSLRWQCGICSSRYKKIGIFHDGGKTYGL